MHRSVLEDADFIAWANENVVVLVGHPKGSHKSVDVAKPAKGEPKSQCSLYPGIACDDHDQVFKDATGKTGDPKDAKDEKKDAKAKPKPKKDDGKPALPKLEVNGFPTSYMIAPDGTVEKHGADRQPGSCRDTLVEFQKKHEESPIPFGKLADVRKGMADGEKAFKESRWKAALAGYAKADAAVAGKLPKALAETLKARLDAIDAKAAARLADIVKGKDAAVKAKALHALEDEVGQALTAGPLPVVAQIQAALAEAGAAPAPAAK